MSDYFTIYYPLFSALASSPLSSSLHQQSPIFKQLVVRIKAKSKKEIDEFTQKLLEFIASPEVSPQSFHFFAEFLISIQKPIEQVEILIPNSENHNQNIDTPNQPYVDSTTLPLSISPLQNLESNNANRVSSEIDSTLSNQNMLKEQNHNQEDHIIRKYFDKEDSTSIPIIKSPSNDQSQLGTDTKAGPIIFDELLSDQKDNLILQKELPSSSQNLKIDLINPSNPPKTNKLLLNMRFVSSLAGKTHTQTETDTDSFKEPDSQVKEEPISIEVVSNKKSRKPSDISPEENIFIRRQPPAYLLMNRKMKQTFFSTLNRIYQAKQNDMLNRISKNKSSKVSFSQNFEVKTFDKNQQIYDTESSVANENTDHVQLKIINIQD